jgi:hypothetical protein
MVSGGALEQPDDVFFCTRDEVATTLRSGKSEPLVHLVAAAS